MSPNRFLGSVWSERVSELAVGIEPTDPILGGRIGQRVDVARDGVPFPRPGHRRDRTLGPWVDQTVLVPVARKDTCRHVLVVADGVEDPVDLRFTDATARYVPRRIRVRVPEPIGAGRSIRPVLFPGAAYGPPAGAMGLRGRVVRAGAPLRWARVEARRPADGLLVGLAHGDAEGEFLLLLDTRAARGADLPLPLTVRVSVFGPDAAPDPDAHPHADVDPLWDLPIEQADLDAGGDAVLAGRVLPTGYVSRPGSVRDVSFSWHGLVREQFDFS